MKISIRKISIAPYESIQAKETIPALKRLFAECSRLEYLHITETSTIFSAAASQLNLPAQLVFLSIKGNCAFVSALLNEENCRALAPTLRSLRLHYHANLSPQLPSHLGLLVNLVYLGWSQLSGDMASLLQALGNMTQLKALELRGDEGSRVINPELCSQLEHLSLYCDREPADRWSEGLSQLKSLRVGHLSTDWQWLTPLVASGRLEFVDVTRGSTLVPVEVVTELISKSLVRDENTRRAREYSCSSSLQNLHTLILPYNKYSIHECNAIVKAASNEKAACTHSCWRMKS